LIDAPQIGEVWWFADTLVLVLDVKERNFVCLTLLDLDGAFDPGEEIEWPERDFSQYKQHDPELTEQNRRIA